MKKYILLSTVILLANPIHASAFSGARLSLKISGADRAAIKISSAAPVNAVRVIIKFDPKIIQITKIDPVKSFCDQRLFIEKNIDNQNGTVIISCGLPGTGFSGEGSVAELHLRMLQTKSFTMMFDPKSQVLAADGLGTEVLTETTPGKFELAKNPVAKTSRKPIFIDLAPRSLQKRDFLL